MISLILALVCFQEPTRIPLPDAVRHSPTISSDGSWIYFFQSLDEKPDNFRKYARNEALFRTSLDGKNIQKIIEVGDTRGRLNWSSDGTRFYVTRRVADTNGDGEIGFGDGMSIVSADPDGKNQADLRAASPDKITIYAVTPAGDLILGLRTNYRETNPRIVLYSAGQVEKELAKAWAYYPLNEKEGMIRTLKVDQNTDGRINFRDVGTLSIMNRETGKTFPFAPQKVIRGPIKTPTGFVFAQLKTGKEGKPVGLQENTAIIQSDTEGKNLKPLTDSDSIWIPLQALKGSVLLHRTRGKETEFGLLPGGGEYQSLWKAPKGQQVGFPRVSGNQETILFAVLRDGNNDGELTPGEDPSDIFKLDLK